MFDNKWGGAQGCTIIEGKLVYGPWVFYNPESLMSAYPKGAGDGDCAKLPQLPLQMPHTTFWRRGLRVLGNDNPIYQHGLKVSDRAILRGTVIATFDSGGKYPQKGGRHAAIYLDQGKTSNGVFIRVIDQWIRSDGTVYTPKIRNIYPKPTGYVSNDAEAFSVVYTTHPGFQKV